MLLNKFNNVNKTLVEIVDYSFSPEDVCKKQMSDKSIHAKLLLDECLQTYKAYFDFDDSSVYNMHERINTNDCFSTLGHDYEYLTNYDIDEVIIRLKLPFEPSAERNSNSIS